MYEDFPNTLRAELKGFSKAERVAYLKGYITACGHTREGFTKVRSVLLTELLEFRGDVVTVQKRIIEKEVELLDYIEASVQKKQTQLESFLN